MEIGQETISALAYDSRDEADCLSDVLFAPSVGDEVRPILFDVFGNRSRQMICGRVDPAGKTPFRVPHEPQKLYPGSNFICAQGNTPHNAVRVTQPAIPLADPAYDLLARFRVNFRILWSEQVHGSRSDVSLYYWEHRTIHIGRDQDHRPRATALFICLWQRGVSSRLCDKIMSGMIWV